MRGLILPRAQPRLVPGGRVYIDWNHPLTLGLVNCYVPGVAGPIDLVKGLNLTLGSTAGLGVNVEGPTLAVANSASVQGPISAALDTSDPLRNWTSCTLYWRGTSKASILASSRLIGIDQNNTNAAPYVAAAFYHNTGGAPGTAGVRPAWNTNNTFTQPGVSITTPSTGASVPYSFGASFVVNGLVSTYLNGALNRTDNFGANGPTYTSTANVSVASYLNGSAGLDTNIACIWNRALSADEIATLDRDPYCFFLSKGVTPSGDGGLAAITADASLTLGAITTSSAATVAIAADSAMTLGAITDTSDGAVAVAASASLTLGAISATSAATAAIAAASALTLDALTLTSAAGSSVGAVGAITLGDILATSAATVAIDAAASITLGGATIVSAAGVQIASAGAITLGAVTVAGIIGAISEPLVLTVSSQRLIYVAADARRITLETDPRLITVDADARTILVTTGGT